PGLGIIFFEVFFADGEIGSLKVLKNDQSSCQGKSDKLEAIKRIGVVDQAGYFGIVRSQSYQFRSNEMYIFSGIGMPKPARVCHDTGIQAVSYMAIYQILVSHLYNKLIHQLACGGRVSGPIPEMGKVLWILMMVYIYDKCLGAPYHIGHVVDSR